MGITFSITAVLLFQTFIIASALPAKDTQPPTIPTGLTVTNVNYTFISLCWAAAKDNTGVKGYQIYRDGKKIVTTSKTSYTNINLIPAKKYTYVVRAYDAAGNLSASSTPLHTAAKTDTEEPSIPQSLSVFSKDYRSITLSWDPSTDNTSIKGYDIYNNGNKVGSSSGTSYVCKKLEPGKTYHFFIKAYDVGGNYSEPSDNISASTLSDNQAPSVPIDLKAASVTETEINLSWSPSSDNVKVQGYEIFCNGSKIKTTGKTTYCISGLIPGKIYQYAIKAVDSVGNTSGASKALVITTKKDILAPTIPTYLKANSIKNSSVSLSWNASSDNIKVKGYVVFCNGSQIGTTTKTSYTARGLSRSTINIFWVKAYDLADNFSARSNCVTVLKLLK